MDMHPGLLRALGKRLEPVERNDFGAVGISERIDAATGRMLPDGGGGNGGIVLGENIESGGPHGLMPGVIGDRHLDDALVAVEAAGPIAYDGIPARCLA